ncbi:LOW QUALITY PROTEIN: MOB kinase activator 3B [Podargus strigoides]
MSIALKQVFNKDKTFRPKRKFEPGTQRFELHKQAQASLNSGVDLKAAVQLPSGEDQNDWVAVHVVDFFNRINLIYGTICEFCTEKTCPVMSGGPKYEYRWQDDMKYKKPTALPAPQYMNLLMDWIEVQINNENLFPTHVGVPFPKNFLQICKKILCRLFRVFVHVYIHHFDRIILMGAEAHINTCYKHFYYFVTELNLIDRKELEPLDNVVTKSSFLTALCLQKGYLSPTPSEERPPRVGFPLYLQKSRSREQNVSSSTVKQDALLLPRDYLGEEKEEDGDDEKTTTVEQSPECFEICSTVHEAFDKNRGFGVFFTKEIDLLVDPPSFENVATAKPDWASAGARSLVCVLEPLETGVICLDRHSLQDLLKLLALTVRISPTCVICCGIK